MDFKNLLQNKVLLYGIIGTVAVALLFVIVFGTINANKSPEAKSHDIDNQEISKDIELLSTDNLGKALEIQNAKAAAQLGVTVEVMKSMNEPAFVPMYLAQ